MRVTGMGCSVRPSSADYVVANLMYNSIALGEHRDNSGNALPNESLR